MTSKYSSFSYFKALVWTFLGDLPEAKHLHKTLRFASLTQAQSNTVQTANSDIRRNVRSRPGWTLILVIADQFKLKPTRVREVNVGCPKRS